MTSNDSLRAAVKTLRLALGKTQTEFGALIGKGLATVQRYEMLVPPKGKVLVTLYNLARENRLDECASLFRTALLTELGMEQEALDDRPLPFPMVAGMVITGPESTDQQNMVAALVQLMREADRPGAAGEEARKEMKWVEKGLHRVRRNITDRASLNPNYVRLAAVVRHHRDGMSAAEIAAKLSVPIELVEKLIAEDGEYSR